MKFFFDNNLPPGLAHGIAGLSEAHANVESVIHLTDRFKGPVQDLEWIAALANDPGSPWYIVSIDKFRKNRGAEREALRRAGHTVYVLDAHWSAQRYWLKCAQLVLWWPQILQHANLSRGGVYRVPWRHSSKSKFMAM